MEIAALYSVKYFAHHTYVSGMTWQRHFELASGWFTPVTPSAWLVQEGNLFVSKPW